MVDVCYYHSPCSDGIGAAWVLRRKYPDANFIGIHAGNKYFKKEDYEGKSVAFVDCCPPTEDIVNEILENVSKLLILDHHITNETLLGKIIHEKLQVVYDVNLSGCQIVWDYFNGKGKRPWFIDYIGDRDIWKFELPNSKLVSMGLYELGLLNSFESLDELAKKCLTSLGTIYSCDDGNIENYWYIQKEILPVANILNNKNESMLEYGSKSATPVKMIVDNVKYKIWLGNIHGPLKSELGNILANKQFDDDTMPDFSAIATYNYLRDEWNISLRSISTDVSSIASKFGGGGHKMASGLTLNGIASLRKTFVPLTIHKREDIISNASQMIMCVDDVEYNVWLTNNRGEYSKKRNEYGNLLARTNFDDETLPDFSVLSSYNFEKDEWTISLRSVSEDVNIEDIATKLGGGGNNMASGFTLNGLGSIKDMFIPYTSTSILQQNSSISNSKTICASDIADML